MFRGVKTPRDSNGCWVCNVILIFAGKLTAINLASVASLGGKARGRTASRETQVTGGPTLAQWWAKDRNVGPMLSQCCSWSPVFFQAALELLACRQTWFPARAQKRWYIHGPTQAQRIPHWAVHITGIPQVITLSARGSSTDVRIWRLKASDSDVWRRSPRWKNKQISNGRMGP